jgi:hypothetical protein
MNDIQDFIITNGYVEVLANLTALIEIETEQGGLMDARTKDLLHIEADRLLLAVKAAKTQSNNT